ncbi:MAG: M24 family metallopeptidase [Acidimicrobiia bacterium]
MSDHAGRITRAREAMSAAGVDVLLLSVGSDLPYLTGYEAMPSERLTMAVIPLEGTASLVVPELEAPRVEVNPEVCSVLAWGEHERPVDLVGAMVAGASRVAIGDHTWSRFLLALQERVSEIRFVPASTITAPLRLVKDATEIALLAAAGAAADRVATRLAGQRFTGRTERNLARFIADALVEEGHDTAAFTIVASGPNGASPHHEPTDRVIETGDTVVLDFGGRIGGYCSDTTRTFSVGEPPTEVAATYAALRMAQQAGFEAVRPGVAAESIDAVTRRVLDDAGYGQHFIHRTGHGIGLEVHEDPYLIAGNRRPLEPGMAFSVEPGVYVPGRFGMRIEDIVVVTMDGGRRLNESSRELVAVG